MDIQRGGGSSTFMQQGAGAVMRNTQDRLRDTVSVKDFGALGNAVADDTPAIQAAINSLAARGGGVVHFPAGTYCVTAPIIIQNHCFSLQGAGQRATCVRFDPAGANQTCFRFQMASAAPIAQCGIRGMTIDAPGNVQDGKVAIRVVDGEEFIIDDIAILNWTSTAQDCVGLYLQGRQAHSVSRHMIFADRPVIIGVNPNIGLSCDHYHFWDCYFCADSNAHPVIEILDGVYVSNLTFDGYQAWVKGTFGLYWSGPTPAAAASHGLNIMNVRWEQAGSPSGYMLYLDPSGGYALNGFLIRNCYGGGGANGIFLRRCQYGLVENNTYAGTAEALNIDASVLNVGFQHNRFVPLPGAFLTTAGWTNGTWLSGDPGATVGVGVVNPTAALAIPNQRNIAGLSTTGAEVPICHIGPYNSINLAPAGQTTQFGGPIGVGAINVPQSLHCVVPNDKWFGGKNVAGTDDVRIASVGLANEVRIGTQSNSLLVAGRQIGDPANPLPASGILYFRDNGSGKTQLVVLFSTGSFQVLATEP